MSHVPTDGGGERMIHLVRHGETEWSRTRRHTGTTDVGLTDEGVDQARALASVLEHIEPRTVLTSPLTRARRTCQLAGFGDRARVDPRLVEWDYGAAEGRTTAEIREEIPGWSIWSDPFPDGETLADVGGRADSVIDDLREVEGPVVLFAHAHLLRILAARWCELPASAGQHLVLDPASVSTLGYERESPCVVRWNVVLTA